MKCMHFLGEGLGMKHPRNTDTSEWKMIVKGSALTKALRGDKHDISLKNLQKAGSETRTAGSVSVITSGLTLLYLNKNCYIIMIIYMYNILHSTCSSKKVTRSKSL